MTESEYDLLENLMITRTCLELLRLVTITPEISEIMRLLSLQFDEFQQQIKVVEDD